MPVLGTYHGECRRVLQLLAPCSGRYWARTDHSPLYLFLPIMVSVGECCSSCPHVVADAGPELTALPQQPDSHRPVVAHGDHAVLPQKHWRLWRLPIHCRNDRLKYAINTFQLVEQVFIYFFLLTKIQIVLYLPVSCYIGRLPKTKI